MAMQQHERLYFVATGRSLAAIEKANAERKAAGEARWNYAMSVGGVGTYGTEESFCGVVFPVGAVPPIGWKLDPSRGGEGKPVFVPDRRRREGKAIAAELQNTRYRKPTARTLFPCMVISGRYAHFAYVEKIGDKTIVSIPKENDGEQYVPDDAAPLKMSEYYRLKEEEAESREGKIPDAEIAGKMSADDRAVTP
jgi:hypothetical protein